MKLDPNTIAFGVLLLALWLVLGGGGGIIPTPAVDPSPIADKGLRVLIVWETASQPTMPDTQRDILYATAAGSVREFLSTKCVKVDGIPEFRIIDKDSTMERESKIWQALWGVERNAVPWIVIANGVRGYSGPLPATTAEVLTLLAKYEVAP